MVSSISSQRLMRPRRPWSIGPEQAAGSAATKAVELVNGQCRVSPQSSGQLHSRWSMLWSSITVASTLAVRGYSWPWLVMQPYRMLSSVPSRRHLLASKFYSPRLWPHQLILVWCSGENETVAFSSWQSWAPHYLVWNTEYIYFFVIYCGRRQIASLCPMSNNNPCLYYQQAWKRNVYIFLKKGNVQKLLGNNCI